MNCISYPFLYGTESPVWTFLGSWLIWGCSEKEIAQTIHVFWQWKSIWLWLMCMWWCRYSVLLSWPLAGVILSDNNAAQICSYQLPLSMHDSDNANEVSGKWRVWLDVCDAGMVVTRFLCHAALKYFHLHTEFFCLQESLPAACKQRFSISDYCFYFWLTFNWNGTS